MVFIKAIGCYIVAFIALLAVSLIFMQGAFVSILPFVAIAVAVVIYKSVFKTRYIDEDQL